MFFRVFLFCYFIGTLYAQSSSKGAVNYGGLDCAFQLVGMKTLKIKQPFIVLERNRHRGHPSLFVKDAEGRRWFLKADPHHEELQTSAEVISSELYRMLGYLTPKVHIVEYEGKRYSAVQWLGDDLELDRFHNDNFSTEFKQLRIFASWLKDWDRLRGTHIFETSEALGLIDFGGTLGARAEGRHKPGSIFSEALGVFEKDQSGADIYNEFKVDWILRSHAWHQVGVEDYKGALAKLKKVTLPRIRSAVKKAEYKREIDEDEMIEALNNRRLALIDHLTALIEEAEGGTSKNEKNQDKQTKVDASVKVSNLQVPRPSKEEAQPKSKVHAKSKTQSKSKGKSPGTSKKPAPQILWVKQRTPEKGKKKLHVPRIKSKALLDQYMEEQNGIVGEEEPLLPQRREVTQLADEMFELYGSHENFQNYRTGKIIQEYAESYSPRRIAENRAYYLWLKGMLEQDPEYSETEIAGRKYRYFRGFDLARIRFQDWEELFAKSIDLPSDLRLFRGEVLRAGLEVPQKGDSFEYKNGIVSSSLDQKVAHGFMKEDPTHRDYTPGNTRVLRVIEPEQGVKVINMAYMGWLYNAQNSSEHPISPNILREEEFVFHPLTVFEVKAVQKKRDAQGEYYQVRVSARAP